MPDYVGDEQNNSILNYIQGQQQEIPNLQNAYKLWNAGKQGVVQRFLATIDSQKWFGHSLFAANVRQYLAYEKLIKVNRYFSSDNPTASQQLSPNIYNASYQPSTSHYSDALLQLKRYDTINSFFGDLVSALDVMSVGLAYLYDFAGIIACLERKGDFDPNKMDFGVTLKFVRKIKNADLSRNCNIPGNFVQLMEQEGLDRWDGTAKKTSCQWYNDLRTQRNYHTHVSFPMLYVDNGEWKLSADPRGVAPDAELTNDIPSLCRVTFDNVHRFMGEVYGAVWNDLGHLLP